MSRKYFGGKYCTCKHSLKDKIIIITGATSGIGKETATILAGKGCEIVLACRDVQRGEQVACDIRERTGNTLVRCERLDLSSFQSVIDFVNKLNHQGTKLHALVNNAGIFYVPYQLTEDGFDLTLQTNYLGPFLLTYLLLDSIKSSAPARIVNVGSESHRYPTDLNIATLTDKREELLQYGTTKLCLMLFTTKLAKLLAGSRVTVNSVNPGNVRTSIYRSFPRIRDIPLLSIFRFLLWLTFKTPNQGAQTTVHSLTDPAVAHTSGRYFSDCAERSVSDLAKSSELEDQLWQATLTWLKPCLENASLQGRVEF